MGSIDKPMRLARPAAECGCDQEVLLELAKRFCVDESTDCWLWVLNGWQLKQRYGYISVLGVTTSAHRVVWEMANGCTMRKDMEAAHLCDNKLCVNPDHVVEATKACNGAMYQASRRYGGTVAERIERNRALWELWCWRDPE